MNTHDFPRETVLRIQHRCGAVEDGDFGLRTLTAVDETLALVEKSVPGLFAGAVQTSGKPAAVAPVPDSIGERIVIEASRYVGLSEIVGNRKWDLRSTPGEDPIAAELIRVLTEAGWQPGWPYCASFVEAVWRTVYRGTKHAAAVASVLNPSCMTSWKNAEAKGWTSKTPAPGAIGIMQLGATEKGHAVIVQKAPGNGWIHTIEGNTSPNAGTAEADRNGDGIYRKTRVVSFARVSGLHLLGFILPPK